MNRVRALVILGTLVLFAGAGAVLVFSQQGPAPTERSFDLSVTGSKMTPDLVKVYEGDTVVLALSADKDEDVHLHGYDLHFLISPGQKVTKTFTADKTGSYDIEVEASGTRLGTLEIKPRGIGLFGLGPQPAASPPAHAGLHHHHGGTQQQASTASYDILLHFGPLEPMYTKEEVDLQHPKVGELILRGDKPPALTEGRHVGAHIFSRSTGKVVQDAFPAITITDTAGPPPVPPRGRPLCWGCPAVGSCMSVSLS